jgi:protein gp37
MAEQTGIEWADSTFNPWIGCAKISPGCDNCYAESQMDTRRHVAKWGVGNARKRTSPAYWKQPLRWNAQAFVKCESCGWRGENPNSDFCLACVTGVLHIARRRVFCASLADVFDNEVTEEWRSDLFDLIEATPRLDWLLLTKRIGNVNPMTCRRPLPQNVWLGATIVNQDEANRDIPKLLAIPAKVRFISCEPLLSAIDLGRHIGAGEQEYGWCRGVDWVIAGGESGPRARPSHPDWFRLLRDQCSNARVPFLFKQWGEYVPGDVSDDGERFVFDSDVETVGPIEEYKRVRISTVDAHGLKFGRMGKKLSGRVLDARTHTEFPS